MTTTEFRSTPETTTSTPDTSDGPLVTDIPLLDTPAPMSANGPDRTD